MNETTGTMTTEPKNGKSTQGKAKAEAAPATSQGGPATVATIKRKSPTDWGALLRQAEQGHWRTLRVTIQLRDKLLAGKPKQLDAETAMIKARGLEDVLEAAEITDPNERAEKAAEVKDEGLCEFYRREGKPGIWMPSNQVKAMLKENWSVLGYNKDARPRSKRGSEAGAEGGGKALQGSRGALAEGVFAFGPDPAEREWIYLGERPDGVDTHVCHTTGPKGPQASIKRNEYVVRPRIVFIVQIARAIADKLPDESLADVLYHAGAHGLGANRSQGAGTFDVVNVDELDAWPESPK